MSLKNGSDISNEATHTLLNTPLANTMKKIGMTPLMNNRLNNFVVKKNTNSNNNTLSNVNSPIITMNRDGTGGP